MPKKRSSQSGSNSATAKLISRINKFGQNAINNSDSDQANDSARNFGYDDDEDEVFVLTAKQKQQLQRNEYLESLTKEQLKIEAKRRAQKTAGTKTELVLLKPKHELWFAFPDDFAIGTEHFFICFFPVFQFFCCTSPWFLHNLLRIVTFYSRAGALFVRSVWFTYHACLYWFPNSCSARAHTFRQSESDRECVDFLAFSLHISAPLTTDGW